MEINGTLHLEARLLYSIPCIQASSISNGTETLLTPLPSTLNLLLVPTTSAGETYLHLHIDPDIEVPLTTETTVLYQAPNSYLIPREQQKGEDDGFVRLEFTGAEREEDMDVWEMVVGEMAAFRDERPVLPKRPRPDGDGAGQIILVDNEDGSVLGELSRGYRVREENIKPGSDDPVVVDLPQSTDSLTVHRAEADSYYTNHPLANAPLSSPLNPPAYQQFPHTAPLPNTPRLLKASHYISQFVVLSSEKLSRGVESGAEALTRRMPRAQKPLTFSETTRANIGRAQVLSGQVVHVSAKTLGSVTKYAGQLGERVAAVRSNTSSSPRDGQKKTGMAYNALAALNQISNSLDTSANRLMRSGVSAASTVVAHRYGEQAGEIARGVGGTIRNAGLVYVDASGVSRRAVVKGAMRGMVVGSLGRGREVVAVDEREERSMALARADGGSGTGTGTTAGTGTSASRSTSRSTSTSAVTTEAEAETATASATATRASTGGLKHSSRRPPYSVGGR